MITLLRNCAHGSEVATYEVRDERGDRFVKVALTPEGRAALECELAGWSWYEHRRGMPRPLCRLLRRDTHVVRIEIDRIPGRPGNSAGGVRANAPLIAAAIEQYVSLWPASDALAPVHGDFSCDNFIDGSAGLVVIDWEHFHPAGAPWGFDAVYLLAESLYFEHMKQQRITAEDAGIVAGHLRRLAAAGPLPEAARRAPVKFAREFIGANAHLWRGELARHPLKLPVLALSDAEAAAIDNAVAGAGPA